MRSCAPLPVVPVDLRAPVSGHAVVPDVADDADDGDPWRIAKRDAEAAADRTLIRPCRSGEAIVDDADWLAISIIRFLERASLAKRNAERREVARRYAAPVDAADPIVRQG